MARGRQPNPGTVIVALPRGTSGPSNKEWGGHGVAQHLTTKALTYLAHLPANTGNALELAALVALPVQLLGLVAPTEDQFGCPHG